MPQAPVHPQQEPTRSADLLVLHDPVASKSARSVEDAVIAAHQRQRARRTAATVCGLRNIRMMHLLERIVERFDRAGVPLMALKGAALNLMLYDRPDARMMGDLDLLIRPEHIEAADTLLRELGGRSSMTLVREDFFPRFYYHTAYTLGEIHPVTVELHARPLGPLRYARLVPPDALWDRAEPVRMGHATVLIPSAEDMLVHLAAHCAFHANTRHVWRRDIKHWADFRRDEIDWDRFLATVSAWQIALPVREAISRVERDFGRICPREVTERLAQLPVTWRDRLALHQAPRDVDHPLARMVVDVLCTPGLRLVPAYVWARILPSREFMAVWWARHRGVNGRGPTGRRAAWLPWAHVLRWTRPMQRAVSRFADWWAEAPTRASRGHARRLMDCDDEYACSTMDEPRGRGGRSLPTG